MLADVIACGVVAALVILVIWYKIRAGRQAKESGGCSCCSGCRGSCDRSVTEQGKKKKRSRRRR